jgi:hypothetical protein
MRILGHCFLILFGLFLTPLPSFALQVGEQVIAVDSTKTVTVIAVQNSQTYVVRDEYGNVYANVDVTDLATEYGCSYSFCVQEQAIAVDSGKSVILMALQTNGDYVVGDQFGNRYANVPTSDLAKESGCSQNLCFGQQVIAVDSAKTVTIVGIQQDGSFAVRDEYGNVYTNVTAADLAPESGCSQGLCVGQRVVALDSGKYVRIEAIQINGLFVVRDDYGNVYPNIDRNDLR